MPRKSNGKKTMHAIYEHGFFSPAGASLLHLQMVYQGSPNG